MTLSSPSRPSARAGTTTRTRTPIRTPIRTFAAAALIALCGLAAAASAQPGPIGLGGPGAPGAPGLGGPRVNDNAPPGERTGFGSKPRIDGKDRSTEIPLPVFVRTVRETLVDSTAKLSTEQDEKLNKMETDLRAAEQSFRKEHGKELRELMGQLEGPGGTGGDGPDSGPRRGRPEGRPDGGPDMPRGKDAKPNKENGDSPAPGANPGNERRGENRRGGPNGGPGGPGGPASKLSPEQREALVTKARELREKGPNPQDAQKAMWAVLSSEQQGIVQPKLDAFIKQRQEEYGRRQAEGQVRRQLRDQEQRDATGETKPKKRPERNEKKAGKPIPEMAPDRTPETAPPSEPMNGNDPDGND